MSLIHLSGITKTFQVGDRELSILRGISLDIEEGEFISFMGPSGSGKSTLFHIMGVLDRPTEGTVLIDDQDVSQLDDEDLAYLRNQNLGFVFQNFNLLSYYTALENVCLPLVYAGALEEGRQAAEELLIELGLEERLHHRPPTLSGGEKQRVAIARALVNHPKIIFADEPTGSLDSKNGQAILSILKRINHQGTTVVLITHDPNIAHHATRIYHMQDGKIL